VNINLNYPVKTSHAIAVILLAAFFSGVFLWGQTHYAVFEEARIVKIKKRPKKPQAFSKIDRPKPQPVSMERLKKQGCVADGLLSEYNPDWDNFAALINRSNCYYLHRAVETWAKPPDFETVEFQMGQIAKKNIVYGMFLAEALDPGAEYFNNLENQKFDFGKMCREGSRGIWGPHTCQADFSSGEYRNYLSYITRRAIDLGIQSFTFGQIYRQESGDNDKNYAPKIVKDIRDYARKKKISVVIGAQTGAITDPDYLKLFDYIEGGVGIDGNGGIESGPCLSNRGSCWALLWHKNFSGQAKNVLLHLDWTGIKSDDLDIFARMDKIKREETLRNLYDYFREKNMGFLMPFFGVLDKNNGGCYGPKKRFYSPDMAYSCRDEDAINAILAGRK
jgi:hypothetical protein